MDSESKADRNAFIGAMHVAARRISAKLDDLPSGCDIALLSAIIHQNSPQQNVELYRKIYHALDSGGTLIIRDHIMDESRTDPPAGALFALNMLVNTQAGDTYTFREVKDTLKSAGFVEVNLVKSGKEMDCLVEAKKPNTPSVRVIKNE